MDAAEEEYRKEMSSTSRLNLGKSVDAVYKIRRARDKAPRTPIIGERRKAGEK